MGNLVIFVVFVFFQIMNKVLSDASKFKEVIVEPEKKFIFYSNITAN